MKIKTTRWAIQIAAMAAALAVATLPSTAAVPVGTSFTYQGQLKRVGVPLTDTCDFEFLLFTADAGGSQVGATQPFNAWPVTNGLFTVELYFGASAFPGDERFLEIAVQCSGDVSLTTLLPRIPLTAVPYASTALKTVGIDGYSLDAQDGVPANAVRVDYSGKVLMEKGGLTVFDDQGHGISLTSDEFVFNEGTSEDPVYEYSSSTDTHEFYTNGTRQMVISAAGNVGIGMTWNQDPSAKLHIGGSAGVDGIMFPDGTLQTSAAAGGGSSLWSESGSDVYYDAGNVGVGTTTPVHAVDVVSDGERAISGENNAASGVAHGVYGESVGINGRGVSGEATASSGTTYGVLGRSYSTGGRGVYGNASASSGSTHGVSGQSWSSTGRGVNGLASATSGVNYGVYGKTDSPDGYAGYFAGGRNYFEGNVCIGQSNPLTTLHLGGTPSVDGLMFPDGTLQTTAAVGGGGDSLWSPSGSDIFYNAGDVGVGTSSPGARFHVVEPVGHAIMGECLGEGTTGYLGHEHAGVFGESSSPGGYAAWFEGAGYFSGNLRVASNLGIGVSSPTSPVHAEGGGSRIIYGKATATSGSSHAVRGEISSPGGAAISGDSLASSGTAAGVVGGAQSFDGVGVLGYNDNEIAPAIGVRGVSGSPTGFGGYFEGRGYFSGNVGIGTSAPQNKLHIVGPDDPTDGPILSLAGNTSNHVESGRIRFRESTSSPIGAFIHYDGVANKLHLGVHHAADSDPASDVNAITLMRHNGAVGIGMDSPASPLHVGGDTRIDGKVGIGTAPPTDETLKVVASTLYGIRSINTNAIGAAILGEATATGVNNITHGVTGISSTPLGVGVYGSGKPAGVEGVSSTTGGVGVYGHHNSSGTGVFGKGSSFSGAHGVRGESASTSGYGGHFINTSSDGTALYAESSGAGREDATLQVHNTEANAGMAAYVTSVGSWATTHMENDGTGEVLWLQRDNPDGDFIVAHNQYSGGTVFRVKQNGWTEVSVLEITGGADLSEQFDVTSDGADVEPGMVVAIDAENPGKLVVANRPYDYTVAGVVSGAGGVKPGMLMGQKGSIADGRGQARHAHGPEGLDSRRRTPHRTDRPRVDPVRRIQWCDQPG